MLKDSETDNSLQCLPSSVVHEALCTPFALMSLGTRVILVYLYMFNLAIIAAYRTHFHHL